MKHWVILLICTLGVSTLQAQSIIENSAQLLADHKYSKLCKQFDDPLKDQVDHKLLKTIWTQTEEMFGPFQAYSDPEFKEVEGRIEENIFLHFRDNTFKMKLVHSGGVISGLLISPLAYSPPSYGKDLVVSKQYLSIPSGDIELEGELVIPIDCNNCPLVILVHGSGALDKDETIGPTKVFNDIAIGLAEQGIATYRYDKRTMVNPEMLNGQFTIYDETINDAITALNYFKTHSIYRFDKVAILGHSLGAYAMPLLADSADNLNGMILFSANARRLEDLILDQIEYLSATDGDVSRAERKMLESSQERAEKIRTKAYTESTPAEELMVYWPGKFWWGIHDYDPVQLTKSLDIPTLILQGEKDYQITMVDFGIWKENLSGKDNVELISYPNLTHLFTRTELEMSQPTDYFKPSNVEFQVIQDIARWVYQLP
ncbi:MAG: alpha/beta hydrolase [Bacteroidia bacterium]